MLEVLNRELRKMKFFYSLLEEVVLEEVVQECEKTKNNETRKVVESWKKIVQEETANRKFDRFANAYYSD